VLDIAKVAASKNFAAFGFTEHFQAPPMARTQDPALYNQLALFDEYVAKRLEGEAGLSVCTPRRRSGCPSKVSLPASVAKQLKWLCRRLTTGKSTAGIWSFVATSNLPRRED
jgi:hypothetical protein